jgi:putative multiple sugar transport system substrate-binding protein
MEDLISGYYTDGKKLDAVISPFDGISYGIAAALEGAGYQVGKNWPLITGQDAELMATKNIISGKQTMTIDKNLKDMAYNTAMIVNSLISKSPVYTSQNFSGIPAIFSKLTVMTKDSY